MIHEFSIAAVFKNESHILEEWLLHYINRNVNHFYLINDNSSDNFMDIINKHTNKITFINNNIVDKFVDRQTLIYEKYLRPILHETEWLAIIDLDEFMYSSTNMEFSSIIKKYEHVADCIRVQWRIFGSNGHIKQPKSVVSGFTKREKNMHNDWWYVKSMFKTKKLIKFEIHNSKVEGNTITFFDIHNPDLIINHYAVQSKEYFYKTKVKRRRLCNDAMNSETSDKEVDLYFKQYLVYYDKNEIDDFELIEQNKLLGNPDIFGPHM